MKKPHNFIRYFQSYIYAESLFNFISKKSDYDIYYGECSNKCQTQITTAYYYTRLLHIKS